MTNKQKFLNIVSDEKTDTILRNKERIKNRLMLRESQQIAIKVLTKLKELNWSQKSLANKMEVSPQQINKIVSGKENLTIETQIKLQSILNIPILASYYESRMAIMEVWIKIIEKTDEKIDIQRNQVTNNYTTSKTIKMEKYPYSQKHYQLAV